MPKKKSKPSLNDYWEEKLHIKYEEEFEYYKKLCGISNRKKLLPKKNIVCSKLITYKEWKYHILKTIDKLDIEELKEYSKYLNQKYRSKDIHFGIFQSIIVPLCISYITICLTFGLNIVDVQIDTITNFFIIILISFFYIWVYLEIYPNVEGSTYKYFYSDVKEIVDETIKASEK